MYRLQIRPGRFDSAPRLQSHPLVSIRTLLLPVLLGTAGAHADIQCAADARRDEAGVQTGVLLSCHNPDPIPKTVVLTLSRLHIVDALPDQSTHLLRPGERFVLRALDVVGQPWQLSYNVRGLLGAPRETDLTVTHQLPFAPGTSALVAQMFGSPQSSHADAGSRHAIDFGVPFGTPVVATRDGVVARIKDGSLASGRDLSFQGKENLVIVYHADDTFSVYGHLEAGSFTVKVGDRVRAGQVLARTGASGMIGGPHLHYALQMRGRDGIVSIPVVFERRDGAPVPLAFAKRVVVD